MQLTTFESDTQTVRAGYTCPCGCTPSVTYRRGGELAESHCCCGNEFVVGPAAERALVAREGFALETEPRTTGWGEQITAAWLVGPSVHPEPAQGHDDHAHGHDDHAHGHDDHAHGHDDHAHGHDDHAHGHDDHAHGHDDHDARRDAAIDPVCGMRVDRESAVEKGLHRQHAGVDYYFCAKGCYLDFGDDPERFLDPSHIPSM